jgi:hypothetical protein
LAFRCAFDPVLSSLIIHRYAVTSSPAVTGPMSASGSVLAAKACSVIVLVGAASTGDVCAAGTFGAARTAGAATCVATSIRDSIHSTRSRMLPDA